MQAEVVPEMRVFRPWRLIGGPERVAAELHQFHFPGLERCAEYHKRSTHVLQRECLGRHRSAADGIALRAGEAWR
jgi:hypothetical protein